MRDLIDGLDVRQEFDRLKSLVAWAGVDMSDVKLRTRHYNRVLRKHGHADSRKKEVLVNTWAGLSRFNVQETLVHELAHIYCDRRYNTREVHSPRFYRHFDEAVQEAYGPLTVAPRTRVGHGRYADAMRHKAQAEQSAELESRIDEVLATPAPVVAAEELLPAEAAPTRGSIGWERLPEPLKSWEKEPRLPLSHWFNGQDELRQRVGRPITGRQRPSSIRDASERVTPAVADERVLEIIQRYRGCKRDFIDRKYEQLHGPYPGKNTYNSIWRLHKAGKVQRYDSHRWYPNPRSYAQA